MDWNENPDLIVSLRCHDLKRSSTIRGMQMLTGFVCSWPIDHELENPTTWSPALFEHGHGGNGP